VKTRALVMFASCLLCARTAAADAIDSSVKELNNGTYKVRLAASLSLSKSKDPRAVIALADAVKTDSDPTIRRVSALALEKMIDAKTAVDARALAFDALDHAAKNDKEQQVRATANAALRALASYRPKAKGAVTSTGSTPQVFVNIDSATDQTKKAPTGAADRVTSVVKRGIEKTGYSTSWPGGLPTSAQLSSSKAQAFIVASTVKKIDIQRGGRSTTVACSVSIRVAPWTGKDGGETWEANRAASAQGSAKATTGNSDRDVNGGVKDCLEAVTEDVTARQVVPFLKRLAAGS
jgi:hypothetical protein